MVVQVRSSFDEAIGNLASSLLDTDGQSPNRIHTSQFPIGEDMKDLKALVRDQSDWHNGHDEYR